MKPNLMLSFHQLSRIWVSTILSRTFLKVDDYINILDDLYINGLIENKSTVFWCENCSLENPSYSEYHGRIAPSKIIKSKCLNCAKSQSYSAIFSLDNLLSDAIFSKDGFLAVYFAWLLEREQMSFEVLSYPSKYENDFIVDRDTLTECKMFKSEKDREAMISELENSLIQIKDHLNSLEEDGKLIQFAYLIWNRYENPEDLINQLKPKYKDLFDNYNFKVYGPEGLEELIGFFKNK